MAENKPLNDFTALVSDQAFEFVARAQTALGFSQREVADAVGTSLRTVQRWTSKTSSPHVGELRKLAVLVHPRNADLAAKLAALTGDTLVSLGLVAPPPPPPVEQPSPSVEQPHAAAPTLPPNVVAALAESVVAAAAESLDVSPRIARPVILAAMDRAKSAGLDVDALLSALRPVRPAPAKRSKRTKRRENAHYPAR